MTGSFRLPKKEAFDHDMHLLLTRKQTNEVKAHPELYKILDKKSPFDYVDYSTFFEWKQVNPMAYFNSLKDVSMPHLIA